MSSIKKLPSPGTSQNFGDNVPNSGNVCDVKGTPIAWPFDPSSNKDGNEVGGTKNTVKPTVLDNTPKINIGLN